MLLTLIKVTTLITYWSFKLEPLMASIPKLNGETQGLRDENINKAFPMLIYISGVDCM